MDDGSEFAWPLERTAEALDSLARASGLAVAAPSETIVIRSAETGDADAMTAGITRVTRSLGLEVESAEVAHGDVERALAVAGPAMLLLILPSGPALLAVIEASGRAVRLLTPDHQRASIATARVASWLRRHVEAPIEAETEQLLNDANVPRLKQPAAREALFRTRLGARPATRGWMLRPLPSAPLWEHMKQARLPGRLTVFIAAYAVSAIISMGAWWLIGRAALEGRLESGTLVGWSFLLLSLVPLAVFAMWSQGLFAIGVGGILKTQLLAGALKLDTDETRHQGIGQHLARVLESEAVEALAVSGGFYALASIFDLLLALFILTSTSGILRAALLLATTGALAGVAVLYFRRRERWTAARLGSTHDLVERMVGHRTRLVQEAHVDAHLGEDEALESYVRLSKRMDNAAVVLAAMPRFWLVVGLATVAPSLVLGGVSSAVLTVQLGVILLAFAALSKMTTGLTTLADAAIGARQVRPLLAALRRTEPEGCIDTVSQPLLPDETTRDVPLIAARGVGYAFKDRSEPVLQSCSFRIERGDRIQLTGPSGGGKSTLVSMLTAIRHPQSGLLLLDGLDQSTIGSRLWRKRIVAAPQFHENHLFNDTLAFNLLMGSSWPPTVEALRRADAVCRRLGLGDLLDRMPGGIFQVVGEGGWQLSHGERSRVYMARALLQEADLVIFDESFAELDPDSLQRYLPEAAAMSRSLMMITHG